MTAIFQTTITLAAAAKALVSIVQEVGPEHTASNNGGNGCTYYTTDGHRLNPVCIVGRYLSDLGVLRATIDPACGEPDGICSVGFELWNRLADMGVIVEQDAQVFLRQAQMVQDDGGTWAAAVAKAIEVMEEKAIAEVREQFNPLRELGETLPVPAPEPEPVVESFDPDPHDVLVAQVLDDSTVLDFVKQSRNIFAIKRLRDVTGVPLGTARAAVMDPRVQSYNGTSL